MNQENDVVKAFTLGFCLVAACAAATDVAVADVPTNIESELVRIGKIVDPACTAKLYRPLMPVNDVTSNVNPLYPGVAIARDVSFGPNPKDVVDIFTADKGPESRPVLIYVPGGGGEKIELQAKETHAFYDNIARWATRNGMVGVNMQRHFSPGWDDGAKDIAKMIQFVQTNAAKYHGDPRRIFVWAHSAGNVPLGTYLGRPELWAAGGSGIKGAILMSPASFNILPLKAEMGSPADMMKMFALAGKTCGAPGPMSTDAPLPGKAAGQPGGPGMAPPAGAGGPPPAPPAVDAAIQLARSSLPALKTSPVKLLLANGELDIGTEPAIGNLMPFNKALHDELCKAGPAHCPTLLVAKGHSHMSIVFSIDTPDTSVSAPILAWIKAN
jgi:Carboxylesterase family